MNVNPDAKNQEQLVNELRECWRVYQELKTHTDELTQRPDFPHELIGTVNQAASQYLAENVRDILLKHTTGTKDRVSPKNGDTEQERQAASPPPLNKKTIFGTSRMYRSETDKTLAGVCGGLAEYFGVDSNIIRVLFILTALPLPFTMCAGLVAYLVLAILLPVKTPDPV